MQANSVVNDVVRASAVRRTLVDWLQRGQLQFTTGGAPSQNFSDFGGGSDELRFVTTAPTTLRSDSTVVQLYVNTPDPSGLNDFGAPHGLVALLTPTLSATRGMSAVGASAPLGTGSLESGTGGAGSGTLSNADRLDNKYSGVGSIVVQLDSGVTALRVDYLMRRGDSTEVWMPSSTFTGPTAPRDATILAVRLTLLSGNSTVLQPVLGLPIVVPMYTYTPP